MFVLEECRSLGIGRELHEAFMNWCKDNNAKKIKVVASANNKKAIGFYRREEFEDYDLVLEKKI